MNKAAVCCLFSCLLTTTAHTQTAPKVVFTGDNFMNAWQQTTQFTANKNWIGAGIRVQGPLGPGSSAVEADFQGAVVSQHPALVQILTGASDITNERDAIPEGYVWHQFANAVTAMVGMAQKAGIKVILGNKLWRNDEPQDWYVEINGLRHEHVSTEILEDLVAAALIVAETWLTETTTN
jgi:hypothetical protein